MPGIEPGSSSFLMILLRAQSTGNCRERLYCQHRRRTVSSSVVPSKPLASLVGKSYFYDTHLLNRRTGSRWMLLPKQQAQAEAWRLFIFSGSLTWILRPRLASLTSTTSVETIHPHGFSSCFSCVISIPSINQNSNGWPSGESLLNDLLDL